MNWYIAICSLVTGFCLGAIIIKFKDLDKIKEDQQEFIRLWVKHNDSWSKTFGRLFDINRQILVALIGRKPDLSVLIDEEDKTDD